VIGNSAYRNTPTLPNPKNDATDMAAALQALGFEVLLSTDLDKRGMDEAFAKFARSARDADAALFFYAGHGLQFAGSNYLMPVDAKLQDEADLPYEMSKVDDIVGDLSRARCTPCGCAVERTASSRASCPGSIVDQAGIGPIVQRSMQHIPTLRTS
jgi:uncharacterized caspase-like protein